MAGAPGQLCGFHLVEKDAPDLARLYFGDACSHRIEDASVCLRARHDCHEPGDISTTAGSAQATSAIIEQ
jgi:hypothetical protein